MVDGLCSLSHQLSTGKMANIDKVIWWQDAVDVTATSHHTHQYQTYCGAVLVMRRLSLGKKIVWTDYPFTKEPITAA